MSLSEREATQIFCGLIIIKKTKKKERYSYFTVRKYHFVREEQEVVLGLL